MDTADHLQLEKSALMLSSSETLKLIGIKSVNTLKRLIREEGFPRPYELMQGRKSYATSEVKTWVQRRMAQQRERGNE